MTQKSPADLVVQKLRTLINEKANQAPSGSPEQYRLHEMLELSDDALLDTLYNPVEPNPDRVGCPSREALRELAVRTRPLSDPLWDHVMECAPCRIDVRDMGREQPVTPARSAARSVGLARAAAVLVLSVSVGGWIVARGSRTPTAVTRDLRQYVVRPSDQPGPALNLPRQLVRLTVLMPNGSQPGRYEIEVRGSDGLAHATASGRATRHDFTTQLASDIDLRSAPPGSCQLAIRLAGGDWQLFPAQVQ